MEWILGIIVIIVIVTYLNNKKNKLRREKLLDKYKSEDIVDKIINKDIWLGETKEQLFDSLGAALDIDQKVMKTKVKEVWKYDQKTKTTYALKVTLENDEVIGWDIK